MSKKLTAPMEREIRQQAPVACSFPLKPTIPYRPWHTDHLRSYVQKDWFKFAGDGWFSALLDHRYKVHVQVRTEPRRIVYSFRSANDLTFKDLD